MKKVTIGADFGLFEDIDKFIIVRRCSIAGGASPFEDVDYLIKKY